MNWREEMNLLNDDQLKRIAYASKDSWGYYYSGEDIGDGRCCVVGHILDDNKTKAVGLPQVYNYRKQLETREASSLENYYMGSFDVATHKITHIEIIENIQAEAKRILEERKARIEEPIAEEIKQ